MEQKHVGELIWNSSRVLVWNSSTQGTGLEQQHAGYWFGTGVCIVSPSANPLKNIGSVYLNVYDRNRPLAPILRQKMVLSGV